MNNSKKLGTASLILAVAALSLGGIPANAADEQRNCLTVTLSPEFIKAYPEAPAACQGVVTAGGKKKLHFKAKVTETGKAGVTLTFLNVRMDPVTHARPLKFVPPEGLDMTVGGKKVKAKDLRVGDTLDFYIPENMLGFTASPESTDLIKFTLE